MTYFRFTLFFVWFTISTPLSADDSVFVHTTMGEAALVGIMYDLKQDQSRHPTAENSNTYFDVVTEFLKKDWDEEVLNHYYRVSNPVYTTQIFIPNMSAAQ
jgi:hypothetical protein